jgi:hypothetical protein
MGNRVVRITIEPRGRDVAELLQQSFPKLPHVSDVLLKVDGDELAGLSETHDSRDVLRAASATAFLLPAGTERR